MNQTVTIKAGGVEDDFGEPTDGTSSTVACRIERDRRIITDREGNESVIDALLIMPPGTVITRNDLVVLDGEDMSVIAIEPSIAGGGQAHHLEVMVGRRRSV